jgi:hypothetical protein
LQIADEFRMLTVLNGRMRTLSRRHASSAMHSTQYLFGISTM